LKEENSRYLNREKVGGNGKEEGVGMMEKKAECKKAKVYVVRKLIEMWESKISI